jgi:alpha-L-fucosidase
MKPMRSACLLLALMLPFLASCSQNATPQPRAEETKAQFDQRMEWWREARFGMFIHWGLYAVPAGEWDGKTHHGEWIQTTAQIPVPTYEKFLDDFNPVKFDADEWALAAKAAGMEYIVITSKHHDGFALFDSAVSDFDVMATPFQRDIMKELAEACERYGLRMCWYHSIMDWHHPDYLPRRGWERADRPEGDANFDRYVDYMNAQVTELLTNYGPIGVMWFDGEWEGTWTHEYGQELYDLCRSLQPDLIVNNRVDKGRNGSMAGMTSGPQFAGDFGTPEQEIPATGLAGVDWETCMTMNRNWGYNAADLDYKSATDLIRKLSDIASKGGNFLLNIGPTAEGTFPDMSLDRLEVIGKWMGLHRDAIQGTTASPFPHLDWGRCTVKTDGDRTKLYLHVFDWPLDGRLVLPGIGNNVVSAKLMSAPKAVIAAAKIDTDIAVRMLPRRAPNAHVSVIELEVEGEPIIYLPPEIHAASDQLVSKLSVELRAPSAGLEVHYTLDGSTPTKDSLRYRNPLNLTADAIVAARCFHDGEPVTSVVKRKFRKVEPQAAGAVVDPKPGLRLRVFGGKWDKLPNFDKLTPMPGAVVETVALPAGTQVEYQGRVFDGYVHIPSTGLYRFALTSDDGSRLLINDKIVVDNDGLHGSETIEGTAALAAGPHKIRVEYFNKTGGATLNLRMSEVSLPWAEATQFFH